MAKTFNDIFPNGKGFVAKPGRGWYHVNNGRIYRETSETSVANYSLTPLLEEDGRTWYGLMWKWLELVPEPEPTGREAIHAAVDAYLDAAEIVEMCSTNAEKARKNFEAEDHALYVSVQSRDERMEALKKLLNL